MNLSGQVAIISGGGRGLGRAYALALAATGAAVAVVARTETEVQVVAHEITLNGGRALALTIDVTNAGAVTQMVATVVEQLGPVDLLVNNAGVLRAIGEVAEVDANDWWREVEINVRGPFLCSHAVLPGMIARRRGRIINLTSVGGLYGFARFSAYSLSKTAVLRLTEGLAAEIQAHGIAVFAINPGNVRTSMTAFLHDSELVAQRAPEMQLWWRQLFAAGQDTPIERSVALVLALASGKADVLTGRYIDVDADLEKLIAEADIIQRDDLNVLRLRTG